MGIEPATCCLRNSCSTTELHRPDAETILAYGRACKPLVLLPLGCRTKVLGEPVGPVVCQELHIGPV